MPVLLILGALGTLFVELLKAVTPDAVKALKDLVHGEGQKINEKYPELGERANALCAKLIANQADPAALAELSALGVLVHDIIRRDYPPDVSGDQSRFEDGLYTSPPAVVEGETPGLPGAQN